MSFFKKSPQTESCTDSGAENEGSCHSDQMSNDFSNDDGVDEGICLESNSAAERISKVGSEKVCSGPGWYGINFTAACMMPNFGFVTKTENTSILALVE